MNNWLLYRQRHDQDPQRLRGRGGAAAGIGDGRARGSDGDDRAPFAGAQRITVGGDKNFDTAYLVADMRALNVSPHLAQNIGGRRSAIDGRTARHPEYEISQQKRKRFEESFDWNATMDALARPMLHGVKNLDFKFIGTMAAYDLIKLPRLISATA